MESSSSDEGAIAGEPRVLDYRCRPRPQREVESMGLWMTVMCAVIILLGLSFIVAAVLAHVHF